PFDADRERELDGARRLAAAGKYREAARAYQRVLGPRPADRFAVEYYETLAGAPESLAEAQAALEELAARNPNTPATALAYARSLSYLETTRRASLGRLEALAKIPAVASQARAAWRQALLWLEAGPSDRPAFDEYLHRYPEDREVAERLVILR